MTTNHGQALLFNYSRLVDKGQLEVMLSACSFTARGPFSVLVCEIDQPRQTNKWQARLLQRVASMHLGSSVTNCREDSSYVIRSLYNIVHV
jgi:hypothetical protein